ncbi:MAG: caspase family protein, partial [Flammeovirgaceae bacterium]
MRTSKILLLVNLLLFQAHFAFSQSSYYDYASSDRSNVFYDSFESNAKNWTTGSTSSRVGRMENGHYYWASVASSGTATTTKEVYVDTNKDFEIEAKIKRYSGSKSTLLQSLLWGCGYTKKNYFGFTGDGSYRISWYDGQNYKAYKDWTTSSSIKKYDYNKMTIRKVKSTMYFFINGVFVHSMTYKPFFGNKIGFQAASSSTLHIDYLRVSYLSKKGDYNAYSYSDKTSIFYDGFSDNANGWTTGYTSSRDGSISSGYYKWACIKSSGTATTTKEIYIDTSKDFEIEGKFQRVSGAKTSLLHSLLWGAGTSKKNYFGFTADGSYRISKYDGTSYSAYKDWTTHSSIKKYGYNKMTIRKVGSKMHFFINETKVHSMTYQPFYGNRIGFQAASDSKLSIDYLRVSYLKKGGGGGGNFSTKKYKTDYNYVSYSDKSALFNEPFDNNDNNWSTGTSGNTSGYVSGGAYTWKSLTDKSAWTTQKTVFIDESRDFEIETKIKYVTGRTGSGIMLKWGKSSSGSDNYNMEFNANGKYWIGRYEDGEYKPSKGWTASTYVKKYDYNKLTVRKLGAKYYFFINEKFVHSMTFQAFYGNKIGFTTPSETTIKVDYIKISYLDKKKIKEDKPVYNAPPTIAISEPTAIANRGFEVVEAKSTKVAGVASDTDGIYKVTINGTRATVYNDGSFSGYVYLAAGSNNIKVVATDNKMKSTTKTFTLDYKEKVDPDPIVKNNEKRLALVIGNSNYAHGGSLRNPVNDARAMKTKLESLGFKVLKYENSDQGTIKRAID